MKPEILTLLADAPSGAFWRAAYEHATPEERHGLFEGLVRDRDRLRAWFSTTFGYEAPIFVSPDMEVLAKGLTVNDASSASMPPEQGRYHLDLVLRAETEEAHSRIVPFVQEEAPQTWAQG